MREIKVGDKVRVVSQGWNVGDLVGRTGIVVYIRCRYTAIGADYLILFDDWRRGHNDGAMYHNTHEYSDKNCASYWWLGAREKDKIVLANTQLEFDFNG
jgi:hypothetical protein